MADQKFDDYHYERPVMENFTEAFEQLLTRFETADDVAQQSEALGGLNQLRQEYSTMYNICHVRHTIDTRDDFYEKENAFFDSNNPVYDALINRFYTQLLQSPFRPELEKRWGSQLFVIAELTLRTFRPSILEQLREENQLVSQYVKRKASAKIDFRGEQYNLASILPLELSQDREVRAGALRAKWTFYANNAPEIENIYDQQVQLRHGIARALGFNNFVELGYARMLRSDYDATMVANFRQQVLDYIVPIATELYERQTKRLGLDHLYYYDEGFRFASGNPKPQGDPRWIIDNASRMYGELSPETEQFFEFMRRKNLMDLVNKDGKATGGYCTYIDAYQAPYIFSNFNGTSSDIDVLTHEAGHAFQVYSSRDIGLPEYQWPTYEACEIHSMSMEFFTWPWMHLFFDADTDKYRFAHLAGAIKFLPYGVAVDEFQHRVYEQPTMGKAERNRVWREIERRYLPHRDYADNAFLEAGGYWQQQSHIFNMPFYYIDYTLAQICAFQFWQRDRADHEGAWRDYLRLCQAGGSHSFVELVKLANLTSPFENGCVESVVGDIKAWLDGVDDTRF
ncbi:MAG: M3 family oligoendopeptidase [Bacteroidota bacterium]